MLFTTEGGKTCYNLDIKIVPKLTNHCYLLLQRDKHESVTIHSVTGNDQEKNLLKCRVLETVSLAGKASILTIKLCGIQLLGGNFIQYNSETSDGCSYRLRVNFKKNVARYLSHCPVHVDCDTIQVL